MPSKQDLLEALEEIYRLSAEVLGYDIEEEDQSEEDESEEED
jgi:hypothetical protein